MSLLRPPRLELLEIDKCGEIYYSEEEQELILHCVFCRSVFRKSTNFLHHFQVLHLQNWLSGKASTQSQTLPKQSKKLKEKYTPSESVEASQEEILEESLLEEEFLDEISLERNEEEEEGSSPIAAVQNESDEYLDKQLNYFSKLNRHLKFNVERSDFMFELIEQLRTHPIIWNTKHESYKSTVQRSHDYDDITAKMQAKFPREFATKNYIRRKIGEVRNNFGKLRGGKSVPSIVPYLKYLQFLNGDATNPVVEDFAETTQTDREEPETPESVPVNAYEGQEKEAKEDDTEYDVGETIAIEINPAELGTNDDEALGVEDIECLEDWEQNEDASDARGSDLERGDEGSWFNDDEGSDWSPPGSDRDDSTTKSDPRVMHTFKKYTIKQNEFVVELIRLLEGHPNIWDLTHPDYSKLSLRTAAYDTITAELQKRFPTELATRAYVRRKIILLRTLFHKSEKGERVTTIQPYYDHLQFLRGRSAVIRKPVIRANANGLFECPICKRELRDRSNLSQHIRRHRKQYSYKCEQCDKQFYTLTHLRMHHLSHTNEKPFMCEMCGKEFRLNSELYRHRKRHMQQRDHKCTVCPKEFYRRSQWRIHMNMHEQLRPEKCDICQKGFYSRRCLKQHMKIHNGVKEHVCTVCSKAFRQSFGLTIHMRSHQLEPSSTTEQGSPE